MLALQAAGLEFDPQNMHQNARRGGRLLYLGDESRSLGLTAQPT